MRRVSRRDAFKTALAGAAATQMPVGAATPQAPARRPQFGSGVEGQRKADLGDGTFLNPIMAGDYPDPSVLKDGADYYMTFSSFDAYPGLQVWKSGDLVNWRPVTAALTKNVGSIWAPELTKHCLLYTSDAADE